MKANKPIGGRGAGVTRHRNLSLKRLISQLDPTDMRQCHFQQLPFHLGQSGCSHKYLMQRTTDHPKWHSYIITQGKGHLKENGPSLAQR
jgi:hypothetical protein